MAAIMTVLVAVAGRTAKMPVLERDKVRGFKGDSLSTTVRLAPNRIGWVSTRVSSVVVGGGYTAATVESGIISVPLESKAAGRVKGMRLRLELGDPLGLFTNFREVKYPDFILDVLPLSLARPPSARRVALLVSGEVPAGSPGMGQELFSIEDYQPSMDTRSIIWKRVARSADQSLFVRIRESNVRGNVRIGLLEAAERGEERVAWMDLLCEGVGLLAKELLDLGSELEFLFGSREGFAVQSATSQQELADALMDFSGSTPDRCFAARVVSESDAVVTGLREAERPEVAQSLLWKPSLFIYEKGSHLSIASSSVIYSGSESIFPLLSRVLER